MPSQGLEDEKEVKILSELKTSTQLHDESKTNEQNDKDRIKQVKNNMNQIRNKYETQLLQNVQIQENLIKDIKLHCVELHSTKYDERIHRKDEIISRKDALIQDLQEKITEKSKQIDSLTNKLFEKERWLHDAIQSKMESLQGMQLRFLLYFIVYVFLIDIVVRFGHI